MASIPAVFTRDGRLDLDGVRAVVERGISEAGSTAAMLTYGDAHLEMLDDEEIRALVRAVVEQAAGRAVVIAATGLWSTGRAVEFARFCRDVGADAIQVTYALRWGAYDGNDLVAHHRAIAEVLPVQLFGHSTGDVHAGLVGDPAVFGYKAETTDAVYEMTARFGNRYQVMTGGAHWAHQMTWALGVRSWMSFWCGLWPEVAVQYRDAWATGDLATALDVVTTTELPFFRVSERYAAGLEGTWRGALEVLGVAPRYRRAPLLSLTDSEMERLRDDLRAIGLGRGAAVTDR